MPADALAPNGARPSADTVLTKIFTYFAQVSLSMSNYFSDIADQMISFKMADEMP